MQSVTPAPTIRPMMYAIRILFIWLFLSGLGVMRDSKQSRFALVVGEFHQDFFHE